MRQPGCGPRCCLGAMPAPEPFADTGRRVKGPVSAVRRRWGGLRNDLDRPPLRGRRRATRRGGQVQRAHTRPPAG